MCGVFRMVPWGCVICRKRFLEKGRTLGGTLGRQTPIVGRRFWRGGRGFRPRRTPWDVTRRIKRKSQSHFGFKETQIYQSADHSRYKHRLNTFLKSDVFCYYISNVLEILVSWQKRLMLAYISFIVYAEIWFVFWDKVNFDKTKNDKLFWRSFSRNLEVL